MHATRYECHERWRNPGTHRSERMNCGPSRKPPLLSSFRQPFQSSPSSRHGRFASRHEKVAVDILSLSKFLHCSVSHRYYFPRSPSVDNSSPLLTAAAAGGHPVNLELNRFASIKRGIARSSLVIFPPFSLQFYLYVQRTKKKISKNGEEREDESHQIWTRMFREV